MFLLRTYCHTDVIRRVANTHIIPMFWLGLACCEFFLESIILRSIVIK